MSDLETEVMDALINIFTKLTEEEELLLQGILAEMARENGVFNFKTGQFEMKQEFQKEITRKMAKYVYGPSALRYRNKIIEERAKQEGK